MHYTISIYRDNEGLFHEVDNIPTRDALSSTLNGLLDRFPRSAGFEFNVTATICRRFTLLDPDVLSGEQVSSRIWEVTESERRTNGE